MTEATALIQQQQGELTKANIPDAFAAFLRLNVAQGYWGLAPAGGGALAVVFWRGEEEQNEDGTRTGGETHNLRPDGA
jgi:hypothetical protein